jgi:hypothetical protein
MQDSPEKGPSGNGSRRRPKEPDDRPRVGWIYVLILGGGAVLFFLGGLLMRNPHLPSYIYSRVTNWLQNENNTSSPLRLPPPPKTAEDYLELTHYDVRLLPPHQRGVALALAEAIGSAAAVQDRLTALQQTVQNDLPTLKSADALSAYAKIKPAAATLLEAANRQKDFFQNLETGLAQQFERSGVHENLAKQIASLFYQGTPGQKAVDKADKAEKLASQLLAIANLLSETQNQWRVSPDGAISSPDKKLEEEYREHQQALQAAIGAVSSEQ